MTLLALATVIGTAGGSSGAGPCRTTVHADASGTPEEAGDALLDALDAVLELDLGALGCAGWHIDLTGVFHLTDTLLWDLPQRLVLAGPAPADGEPARLEAVTAGAPGTAVTHRILTATPRTAGADVGRVTIDRVVLVGGEVQTAGALGGAVLADELHLFDSEIAGSRAVGGGGVAARVVLAERVSFVGNDAIGAPEEGGAIRATQSVTLENVTFGGNGAAAGGAIWLPAAGTLHATFVTFVGNTATAPGGADLHRGATGTGTVSLRGVLFGGTVAAPSCGGVGLASATLTVEWSFGADSSCSGVETLGGPLDFASVPFLPGTTPLPVPDGGPAEIGQVACSGVGWPTFDQRGVARPQGGTCDAGAVQRIAATVDADDPEDAGPGHADPTGTTDDGETVGGPVPLSIPAGDGACADGCQGLSRPRGGPVLPR